MAPPLFHDIFFRLPRATAVLLLNAVFCLTNAHASPRQTKVIGHHELDVISFPLPVPTPAPFHPFHLQQRQENTICGYLGGNSDFPATCLLGSHCVLDLANSVVGCCPNGGVCTTGVFTGCVDRNSHPQTEINPYVFTCRGSDVCFKNNFAGGFYQYGCGTASELGTTVETSASGASAALSIETAIVSLTASPSLLATPTTIGSFASSEPAGLGQPGSHSTIATSPSTITSPSSALTSPSSAVTSPSSAATSLSSAVTSPSSAVTSPSSAVTSLSSAITSPSSAKTSPSSALTSPLSVGTSHSSAITSLLSAIPTLSSGKTPFFSATSPSAATSPPSAATLPSSGETYFSSIVSVSSGTSSRTASLTTSSRTHSRSTTSSSSSSIFVPYSTITKSSKPTNIEGSGAVKQAQNSAIIGGIVGGTAAAISLVALVFFCARRRNRNHRIGPGPTPSPPPTTQYTSPMQQMQSHGTAFAPLPSWHDEEVSSATYHSHPHPQPPDSYGPLEPTRSRASSFHGHPNLHTPDPYAPLEASISAPPPASMGPTAHGFPQPLRYNPVYMPTSMQQPGGSLTPVVEEDQSIEREDPPGREIDDFSRAYSSAGIGQLSDAGVEEDRTPLRYDSRDMEDEEALHGRSGGHRPLWQQNRQQSRNLMWL